MEHCKMNRTEIADLIVNSLEKARSATMEMYRNTSHEIGYFYIDDVLPAALGQRIYESFPHANAMRRKKSLREYKYISAQMNNYDHILEEAIYAFQDPRVVSLIAEITGITKLFPDEHLYAGGISLMGDGQFLNPHLDNSHDKDRDKWRVLNLLYYVTPAWPTDRGGNLELWSNGLNAKQIVIHSKFNRLVVMATHMGSWHSVSPISFEGGARCCLSNYYFAEDALKVSDDFHVTSFRGRPEQKLRDLVLQADIRLRMAIRKLFRKGIVENKHVYKRPN
jgi:Rps23 Pro-64 3,4-dihydroxylase Tpa1-like proline 4-hydroxylase